MRQTLSTKGRVEFAIIGQELKSLRKRAGLTHVQVEEALGKYSGWVTKIEQAQVFIDYATMSDFVSLCGEDFVDFVKTVQQRAAEHYRSLGQRPPFK